MITVFVQFQLPQKITREKAAELFEASAERYRTVDGLVRKYYLHDPDNDRAGGCYLFHSRAEADAAFDGEWLEMVTEKYGGAPDIRYFETPVIVDNDKAAIQLGSAA